MSRGARGLSAFDSAWSEIVEARPEYRTLNLESVWLKGALDFSRIPDTSKLNLVSLMRLLKWRPATNVLNRHKPDTDGYWKFVISNINLEELSHFVDFAKKSEEPINTQAPMHSIYTESTAVARHSNATWGTW